MVWLFTGGQLISLMAPTDAQRVWVRYDSEELSRARASLRIVSSLMNLRSLAVFSPSSPVIWAVL
jgi:hypothetical protein